MRIIFVWIISAMCYIPLYFEQLGYAVPNLLLQMKYLFVAVPIIIALICVKRETDIKKWFSGLFAQKIGIEPLVLCGVIGFCGILCTSILNKQAWDGISSLFSILYLFCMATLEEIAWRGLYLESTLQKRTERIAVLIVSLEWAVWHIPMWAIRNSLSVKEIAFWLIYTVLVGSILCKSMIRYKNILVPIILHTIFNVCFLIPIKINVVVVLCVWIGDFIFEKIKGKRNLLQFQRNEKSL